MHWKLCEMRSVRASRSDASRTTTTKTAGVEQAVLEMVTDQPIANTRAWCNVGVSQSTTWQVLKSEMLHSYSFRQVEELIEKDFCRLIGFVRWILQQSAAYIAVILRLHFRTRWCI